jgi:uncharacterized membrane protein SirB2
MLEFYPQIKHIHVVCVLLSGGLFAARGVLLFAGYNANHPGLRWLSYAIDSALLAAALMLVAILHTYPFQVSWLTVKVLLIIVYIVLGSFALRRARNTRRRATCFAAALVVYLFLISVALTHDPLGVLRLLFA